MGSDAFAVFSSPSFDISLRPIASSSTMPRTITSHAIKPPTACSTSASPSTTISSSPCCFSSVSSSSSPMSPPLSPRSQFAALTVRIPVSTSSSSATSSTSQLALPTLPTTLTDPSQLRFFWPHHYYGADIDRIAAPLFQEWKQRPFYLAALRTAARHNRRCLRCQFNPKLHTLSTAAPLTPPMPAPAVAAARPCTPPVGAGSGGTGVGFVECVRAPRKPWYSAEFMKELCRREKKESSKAKETDKGKKRQREEEREEDDNCVEESSEQQTKKCKAVSWEAEEVNTLTIWSGLPPLPAPSTSPTKRLPLTDSSPLLTLPLSPTPSSSIPTTAPTSPSTPPHHTAASSAASSLPLSPVSVLCGGMTHLLSPLSPRNDVRGPVQFQRLSHSPLFRKQRRVLPPVPKMSVA